MKASKEMQMVPRRFRRAIAVGVLPFLFGCGGEGGGEAGAGGGAAGTGSDGGDGGSIPSGLVQPGRANETAPATYRAHFETTGGEFTIQVQRDWAPRAADRFYNLLRVGYYDSVYVHRVVPGRVAQFGIHPDPRINYVWQEAAIQDEPVEESNERGTVSFAKSGPNSRTSQVFVNLRDNPGLDDQDFAPFGEVVEGMEVVDSLYSGYGDGPPRGEGPYPAQAAAEGNEYFEREFPELDQILEARIVEP
ncbi:MAG: peptidylprolyl isomerase [Gemmatimonadota bacterium]